jgi:hypothetical protein
MADFSFHQNVDFWQNRLNRAALELLSNPPASPVVGRVFQFAEQATNENRLAYYAGTSPSQFLCVIPRANVADIITGLWNFNPTAGTLPFEVGLGRNGIVTNLNSDRVDNYHANTQALDGTGVPQGTALAVYHTDGTLTGSDPTNPYSLVNKRYMDANAQGLHPYGSANLATTTLLATSATTANTLTGNMVALTVDGVAVVNGYKVLVKDQTNKVQNGIYVQTREGNVSTTWQLTRAADADQFGEMPFGLSVFIDQGTTNDGSTWVLTKQPGDPASITPGTDANTWSLFSKTVDLSAGNGIVVAANKIHFFTAGSYQLGSLYYASSISTIAERPPPTGNRQWLFCDPAGVPTWGNPGGIEGDVVPRSRTFTFKSTLGACTFSIDNGAAAPLVTFDLSANRIIDILLPQGLATSSTPTFDQLTITTTTPTALLTEVFGRTGAAGTVTRSRSWANFLDDLRTGLPLPVNIVSGTGNVDRLVKWTSTGIGNSAIEEVASVVRGAVDNTVALGDATHRFSTATIAGNTAIGIATATERLHVAGGNGRIDGRLSLNTGATPAALLDLGSGTTTVPPVRFHPSINSRVTTLAPGALETDLATATPRGRLYFTDGVPARRGLAFTDELNFTNDPWAASGGGVGFYGQSGANNFLIAAMDGQVIGTGDFTVWMRFKVDGIQINGIGYGLFSLTSSATGGTGPYDLYALVVGGGSTRTVQVIFRNEAGVSNAVVWNLTQNTNNAPGDLVVTRKDGVVKVYWNGLDSTPIPTGTSSYQASPVANSTANLRFHVGNATSSVASLQGTVQRAAIYNCALNGNEVLDLIRSGILPADEWGSTVPIYASNFTSGIDGWAVAGGVLARVAGPVGGQTDLLQLTTNSGTNHLAVKGPPLPRAKRVRTAIRYYAPGSNIDTDGVYLQNFNTFTPGTQATGKDVWNTVILEAIDSSSSAGSNTAYGVYTTKAANINYAGTATDVVYFRDSTAIEVGALVDLDLAIGVGSVVPDRSARFPGTLNGTLWFHTVPKPSSNGPGIWTNLRKYVLRGLSLVSLGTPVITHGLGTTDVVVQVWRSDTATPELVQTAILAASVNTVTLHLGIVPAGAVGTVIVIA